MRVYGAGAFDNERADLVVKGYVRYCFERIEEALNFLNTDDKCQVLLAELTVLIMLAKLSPDDVFVKLKRKKLIVWQEQYNQWYERNKAKLPAKYRVEIKNQADEIFTELHNHATDLDWL